MKKRILIIVMFIVLLVVYSKMKMNQDDPKVLEPLLADIENAIQFRDQKDLAVSKVDVAWQLDHMLKVINRITDTLERSNPDAYSSSINAARTMSLTAGYIPRGRAQSPDVVRPPEIIITEDIYAQLEDARANINTLIALDKNANFEHPYFGQLNKGQAVRFLEVHTKHHLKIVDDILK